MGWLHINALNEVLEQLDFDDFVLVSSPCESVRLAPPKTCAARFYEAWCSCLLRPAVASKSQQAT